MAIGSLGSSILAVKVIGVKLPILYWLILPLCVLMIYTSDHLLDGLKVKDKATMGRHYFHYLHRKTITVFLVLIAALSMVLIMLNLDNHMIFYGFFIYFIILSYILSNHFVNRIFKFFPRELIITIGYMAGTWGFAFLSKYPSIRHSDILIFIDHFLIILSIPLLYSIYEYDADKRDGFISFATTFGIKITGVIAFIILTISVSVSTVYFILNDLFPALILISMAMCLFTVIIFQKKLSSNENYRIIGDSVNFLPFLLLIK